MHDGSFAPALSGLAGVGLTGVHLGRITAIGPDGRAQVTIPALSPETLMFARSLVPIPLASVGREAAVTMLADADPLILGLIQPLVPVVEADGDRLVLEAGREVVLRCGAASITMTADGRITLRGTQILSRSDGPNRVQGASVQLN